MTRRMLVIVVAALLASAAACTPTKPPPPPPSEHQQCVNGAEEAHAAHPELTSTVPYVCADFGDTTWIGLFTFDRIQISEHFGWYDEHSPAGGYYCVAAHEWGHAWDWYVDGPGSFALNVEGYAIDFAHNYFGCPLIALEPVQPN